MESARVEEPEVTIVIVPRERFSFTRESLESICEHTEIPFKLIYIDGRSPRHIRRYLNVKAREKNFDIIRTEYYLSPNRARNLGLRDVTTKYVAFIDNDVVVSPGWLNSLVNCAEKTGASIVGPVVCQNYPVHEMVHCAGGEARITPEGKGAKTIRRLVEKIYYQGLPLDEAHNTLRRSETELIEFHCMLVRMSIFEQVGLLDEGMLSTKEYIDFCLTVRKYGGSVYLEPASVVTFLSHHVPLPPLIWTDVPFIMLRWSDAWELASLHHLRDKWNLTEDQYFTKRYQNLGWRRRMSIIDPLVNFIPSDRLKKKLGDFLFSIDKKLNNYIIKKYYSKQAKEVVNKNQ